MHRTKSESGFTLIELVIVIVILGILAAVAIQYARNALNGHSGFPPLDGTIFAEGRVPKEPINGSSNVKIDPGVDNSGGWVYQQATGIVKVNLNAYSSY